MVRLVCVHVHLRVEYFWLPTRATALHVIRSHFGSSSGGLAPWAAWASYTAASAQLPLKLGSVRYNLVGGDLNPCSHRLGSLRVPHGPWRLWRWNDLPAVQAAWWQGWGVWRRRCWRWCADVVVREPQVPVQEELVALGALQALS